MWEMEGRGSSGHFRRSEVDGVLLDELEAGMIRSNGKKFHQEINEKPSYVYSDAADRSKKKKRQERKLRDESYAEGGIREERGV